MKKSPAFALQPKLTANICTLLSEGLSIKSACSLSGVCERVFHEWQRRGQSGEEPYASFFFDSVSRAQDSWKARLIRRVEAASQGDWRAAAFLLERQYPSEFGTKIADVPPLAAPVIHVTIQRDKATDE